MAQIFNARQFTKLGFIRRPELDFSDDGTRFRMYEYEGIPVSYTTWEDYVFISIRPDYMPATFNYKLWMQQPEYPLCDMFNYVKKDEVDMAVLLDNVKKIAARIKKMSELKTSF